VDLTDRKIWQQAAGNTNRNYVQLCLNWGVVLNGPGNYGSWPDCETRLRDQSVSERKITDLRRFCEDMADGDVVVLRMGTTTVFGVGLVVGDYEYREAFGDVDGWQLQHVRRVRWLWKAEEGPERFETYALKLGDTTQELSSQSVIEWLSRLEIPKSAIERSLPPIPDHDRDHEIDVEDIPEFLFDRGVASDSINSLVTRIGELIRISKWYRRSKRPSEHETVAYLVVPLLRTLGWTPQRMAVEWKKLDLALFSRLPRSDNNVRVVVEAKKFGQSCLTALSQAKGYAQGKNQCERLIVTDGIRYGVYRKQYGLPFELHAYLNLTRMRSTYPIYRCAGAREALFAMTPEWNLEVDLQVGAQEDDLGPTDDANGG
jgi:hypothetical protein